MHTPSIFQRCNKLEWIDVMFYFDHDYFCGYPIVRNEPDDPFFRGKCGPKLTYLYNHNTKILTISGSSEMTNSTYTYRGIESIFIRNRKTLENVIIEENVESIGTWPFFKFESLTSLKLSKSVKYIYEGAFYACPSLISFDFSDSITYIGKSSFGGCKNLTSIDILHTVESIEASAFDYCTSITHVNITEVHSLGNGVFQNCIGLTSFVIPSEIVYIPNYLLSKCSNIVSIYIPNTITSIGYDAFKSCISLLSISIPSNVSIIGNQAFYNCKSLKSVVINGNLSKIKHYAFANCSSLSHLLYKGLKYTSYYSDDYIFLGCDELKSIEVLPHYKYKSFCGLSVYYSEQPDESESSELPEESANATITPIKCNSDAPFGCSQCYENNLKEISCFVCNTLLNFNKEPDENGMCYCTDDFVLSVNGECFEYIQNDP